MLSLCQERYFICCCVEQYHWHSVHTHHGTDPGDEVLDRRIVATLEVAAHQDSALQVIMVDGSSVQASLIVPLSRQWYVPERCPLH